MRASTPALAHSRFTPSARARISSAAAASDTTDVTSTPIPSPRPPLDSISAATASAFARWMSATATIIPSAPSANAMPRPIPLPPPVTTATRPFRSSIRISPLPPQVGIVPGAVEWLHASPVRREMRHPQELHRLPVAQIVDGCSLELLNEGSARMAQDDRREPEEIPCDLPGAIHQRGLRQQLVHRAPVMSHPGRDLLAHQLRIAKAVPPEHQRPDVLDPIAGREIAREVGQVLEVRVLRREDDVAHQRQLGVDVRGTV